MTNSINAPGAVWNEETNIWNFDSDNVAVAPGSVYYRVPPPIPASEADLSQVPPVLTNPGALPSDLTATVPSVSTPAPVAYQSAAGPFSATRAIRVLDQYRAGFWGPNGVVSAAYPVTGSDPSQSDIAAMYQNFQLFSYLPSALMPTLEQFADLVSPSKVATYIQNNLSLLGINTSSTQAAPITKIPLSQLQASAVARSNDSRNGLIVADLLPFANKIGVVCSNPDDAYTLPGPSFSTSGFGA